MNINPSVNPPERPFRLFISYARENEVCKDRLKINLSPLRRNGWVDMWDDRAISAGADWREEIEKAMAEADAAIFLLEEYFLASDFCMDVEIATLLQRHRDEGTLILFILSDHCQWDEFDFIRKPQLLPRDAKPIIDFDPPSLAYTAIAREIKYAIAQHSPKLRAAKTFLVQEGESTEENDLDTLLAKLPGATTHLFGRDAELAQINSWKDHKGVFLWVADGGTGKSTLVRWWLEHQEWPAGARFLGHSFYSQGSHNQATSARSFLLDALKQLNVTHEINAADDELGRLLAKAVAKESTVLVLDGIEPLQQISEDEKLNGLVKDRGLAALLEELVKSPGKALCLASSRLPIPDISIADGSYFKEKTLGLLPPDGALLLLRQRGVRGEDDELGCMAERCGYHPLALVLAAEFCHTFMQDRAAEFLQREWQTKPGEKHAATVMAWFDSALAEEHQVLDRELVRILGLFDRPAPWGVLLSLKQAAPILGLTSALHAAGEAAIMESLARLSQWGLLNADLTHLEPELDAHPLVREHFGALLEQDEPQAWQAAHSVLFDWFCSLPEKEQPDTLEELEPLYRAVGHGCKSGRYLTALEKVYRDRIQRVDQNYTLYQLGAYSSDLAALAGFFPQGWNQPPVVSNKGLPRESLSEDLRIWLLGEVAFCLAAMGWLEDSLMLRRMVMQQWRQSKDWDNFCRSSESLVYLLTSLGRWAEAETSSRKALIIAERIADEEERYQRIMMIFTYLGCAMLGQGRLSEALVVFKKAETILARTHINALTLHSIYGYDYAQLLLEQAGHAASWRIVLARGHASLKIVEQVQHLLSQALDHSTIGLAHAALGVDEAGHELDLAVSIMQGSGSVLNQPSMHLARASYLRAISNCTAAWADHDAAHAISKRGNMRTYLAECALLAGNLYLDEVRVLEAAAQYATAAQLIREDGYGRRYAELHLLHARLLYAQHDPAVLQTLDKAEARIREVGQWYFWRELRAVAKEIGAPDPGACPA